MFPIHVDLSFIGLSTIYFYEGLYIGLSFVIGLLWARPRVNKYGLDLDIYDRTVVWTIIGALLGVRLSHVIFWEGFSFFSDPLVLFRVWEGGSSVTGGLAGGILVAWIYTRRSGMSFASLFAVISPALLLAQAVGRVGCFLNGDSHGIATTLPWGVQYPKYGIMIPSFETAARHTGIPWDWAYQWGLMGKESLVSAPLHPTQLYEFFGDIVLMVIVILVFKRLLATGFADLKEKSNRMMLIFFIHTGGYSLLRFFIEFIRADSPPPVFLGMSGIQAGLLLWAICSVVLGGLLLWKPPAPVPIVQAEELEEEVEKEDKSESD
ncbi:MAG: prolipoprotein diacylglyceryl transferase [bacterium]|nr:prolipoprotein diacylglyceryl transferase [bacterium]